MAVIKSDSISEAWIEAVQTAADCSGHEAIPLVINIDCDPEGRAHEDLGFRSHLNRALESEGCATVETVARTIFPKGFWNRTKPREDLYARYFRVLPKLRKCSKNKRGQYFERLIGFQLNRNSDQRFNQLEHVIQTYKGGNHRRSALQASLVNPFLDWNNSKQLGFPCLHQVAFLPRGRDRTLRVMAYYPLHYLFERAYGNYLGLMWLGEFMAHEMELFFEGITCVSGVAALEVSEKIVAPLLD